MKSLKTWSSASWYGFWAWADTKTDRGNARSVTGSWVDRYVGLDGFAEALQQVGWLRLTESGTEVPGFDKHFGQGAKSRALTSKRVSQYRKKCNAGSVTDVTSGALPEKRREEKNPLPPFPSSLKEDSEFVAAWQAWQAHREEAGKPLTKATSEEVLAKLAEWGPARAIAAIRYTIFKGWIGLEEPEKAPGKSETSQERKARTQAEAEKRRAEAAEAEKRRAEEEKTLVSIRGRWDTLSAEERSVRIGPAKLGAKIAERAAMLAFAKELGE